MSESSTDHSWKQFVSVSGGLVCGMMGGYIIPIQIGTFMGALGLNEAQSGILGTVELISTAVVMLIVSLFVNRVASLKRLAISGAMVVFLAQLMTGFFKTYEVVWCLRLLAGGGAGIVFSSVLASTPFFQVPEKVVARGFAIASGLFAILLYGLPLVGEWLGYKGFFISVAIIELLIIASLNWLPTSGNVVEVQEEIKKDSINYLHLALFFGGVMMLALSQGALWSFSERIGVELNLTGNQIGITLGLSSVAMILGSLTADFLGNRAGYFLPLVVGSLANGMICLGTSIAGTFWIYMATIILYGFIFNLIYPYLIGYGANHDNSGFLASMAGSVFAAAYALGPMLGGIIMTRYSAKEVGELCLALSLCAMVSYGLMILKFKQTADTTPVDVTST